MSLLNNLFNKFTQTKQLTELDLLERNPYKIVYTLADTFCISRYLVCPEIPMELEENADVNAVNNLMIKVDHEQYEELKRVLVNIFTIFDYQYKMSVLNDILDNENRLDRLYNELLYPIIGWVVNDLSFAFKTLDTERENKELNSLGVFDRLKIRNKRLKLLTSISNSIRLLTSIQDYKEFYDNDGLDHLKNIMSVYFIYINELNVGRLNKKSLKLIETLSANGSGNLPGILGDIALGLFEPLKEIPNYSDKVFADRLAYSNVIKFSSDLENAVYLVNEAS